METAGAREGAGFRRGGGDMAEAAYGLLACEPVRWCWRRWCTLGRAAGPPAVGEVLLVPREDALWRRGLADDPCRP